jgi:hypothetical protein
VPNPTAYYARFQSARGRYGSLPPLARSIVGLFAIPGIVLLLLSILLGLVSIFILLLLTVPVYQVLQAVFGSRQPTTRTAMAENSFVSSFFGQMPGTVNGPDESPDHSPGVKQVDAKIIDAGIIDAG